MKFAEVTKACGAMMLDSLSSVAEKATTEVSAIDIAEFNTAMYNVRSQALAIVLVLADDLLSGDLEDDETPSDRLNALTSEYEDEYAYSVLVAHMQDAMYSLGVDEPLAVDVFESSERQDEAIEAMAEIINSNVPDDDEFDEWRKHFIYAEPDDFDDDEAVQLDGMVLDGLNKKPKKPLSAGKTTTKKGKNGTITYKAVKAVRNGKVVTVNKRVSGKVILSAKQKQALNKARAKSHTGSAIRKKLRSLDIGLDRNIYLKK